MRRERRRQKRRRNVCWNCETCLGKRLVGAEGEAVVEADQSRRSCPFEQPPRGAVSEFRLPVRASYRARHLYAGGAQGFLDPLESLHSSEAASGHSIGLRPCPDETDLPNEVTAVHVGTLALTTDPPGAAVAAYAEDEAQNCVFHARSECAADADRGSLCLHATARPAHRGRRSPQAERLRPRLALSRRRSPRDRRAIPRHGRGLCRLDPRRTRGRGLDRLGLCKGRAVGVTVVDTIGAGDAFGAGLLAWLRRHDSLNRRRLRKLEPLESKQLLPMQWLPARRSAPAPRHGPQRKPSRRLVDRANSSSMTSKGLLGLKEADHSPRAPVRVPAPAPLLCSAGH